MLERLLKYKPDLVVLAAGWSVSDALLEKLDETIAALNRGGVPSVVLGVPPLYREGVPAILVERMKAGDSNPFSGKDLQRGFTIEMNAAFEKHFVGRRGSHYVSIMRSVCPENQCPLILHYKIPVHFDPLHLTPDGSKYFGNILFPQIIAAARN